EPTLIIEDVFEDQPGVYEVRGIGVLASVTAWQCIGVVHTATNPKGLDDLPARDAFGQSEAAKPCSRKAPQGSEPAWRRLGAGEPAPGRERDFVLNCDGRTPRVRVLDNGAIFHHQTGIAQSR